MSKPKRANPKEIVEALMPFVGKERRLVYDKTFNRRIEKDYLTYRCPKPTCSISTVSFLDKTGFKNPNGHLKCYGRGKTAKDQDETAMRMYSEAISATKQRGGTIRSHFQLQSLSEYDLAMHEYIRLVVMKNVPISMVQDPDMRKLSKYTVSLAPLTVTRVIFQLVILVEKRIADELSDTQGAVMYDGWSYNNTQYAAAITSYCATITARAGTAPFTESKVDDFECSLRFLEPLQILLLRRQPLQCPLVS